MAGDEPNSPRCHGTWKRLPAGERLVSRSAGGEAMMRRHTVKLVVAVSALALLTGPVRAEDAGSHGAHRAAGARVDEVDVPTSCSPDVQGRFNQAVWTLHSFWYEEA